MLVHRGFAKCSFYAVTSFIAVACGGGGGGGGGSVPPPTPPPPASSLFNDVTATHVEGAVVTRACMDAQAIDFDKDSDLDLVLAIEFGQNLLLLNDGSGRFTIAPNGGGLLNNSEDHEDIAYADFDADNDIDLAVASEDTMVHEIYLNQGSSFSGFLLGATSVANAVVAFDMDNDGDQDLIFGGESLLVMENNGSGSFAVYTGARIPTFSGTIQDIVAIDVDKDNDLDLVFGVEGQNQLLLNDGRGVFTNVTQTHLAAIIDETRLLSFADVDLDGDVDMFVGNVRQELTSASSSNLIYLNNGEGRFLSASSASLGFGTYGGKFVDFDNDSDPDLLLANANILTPTDIVGYQLYRNVGGVFSDITTMAFGGAIREHGFGVATGDFNRDGKIDFYLCSRGSGAQSGASDHLFFQR